MMDIMNKTILDYLDKEYLKKLYSKKLRTKKSIGIDGVTSKQFNANIDDEIEIINRKISKSSYDFSFYKEKLILKGRNSNPRAISIPTNRDKLVLKTLHFLLQEVFEDELSDSSIHKKIVDIKKQLKTKHYDSFVKIDVEKFYPSINHDILMKILEKKITDKATLELIRKAITQQTVAVDEENKIKYGNQQGVPQGLSISGILASIYLIHIDDKYENHTGYAYYRFVDDILVLCKAENIETISQKLVTDLKNIKLKAHTHVEGSEKSSYGLVSKGFKFLGYKFQGRLVTVRETSLDKMYRGINKVFLTHHKYADKKNVQYLYKRLNLKITGCVIDGKQYGWLFFFSLINDQTLLFKLDTHVKKLCERFDVPYDTDEIKKFSRTYYELKKLEKSNYIPKFKDKNRVLVEALNVLIKKVDVPKKREQPQLITEEVIQDIENDIDLY